MKSDQNLDLGTGVQTYAQQAYVRLKASIISGGFWPGDAMRERDLVDRMGISRTPIREALQRLINEGIVEAVAHKGVRVRRLESSEARSLYEVRGALERCSVQLAAVRGDMAEIEALEAAASSSTGAGGPADEALLANQNFHVGIARITRNPQLVEAIERNLDQISLWRLDKRHDLPQRDDIATEHAAILEALLARDADTAMRLMEAHVAQSWASYGRKSTTGII